MALYHGLARDLGARSHDLRPLKRELAQLVRRARGRGADPSGRGTTPPRRRRCRPAFARRSPMFGPSPSSAPRRSVPAPPPPKKPSKIVMLAVAGISAGLIGGWVFSRMRAKPKFTVVEVQKPAPPVEPKKAIELGDVPVTGQRETASATTDKTGSCVSGYMPKGTFEKAPDMAWVCDETDPRIGAEKLRISIINGAKGATTRGDEDLRPHRLVRHGSLLGGARGLLRERETRSPCPRRAILAARWMKPCATSAAP